MYRCKHKDDGGTGWCPVFMVNGYQVWRCRWCSKLRWKNSRCGSKRRWVYFPKEGVANAETGELRSKEQAGG